MKIYKFRPQHSLVLLKNKMKYWKRFINTLKNLYIHKTTNEKMSNMNFNKVFPLWTFVTQRIYILQTTHNLPIKEVNFHKTSDKQKMIK
jgi:hypothetical protein